MNLVYAGTVYTDCERPPTILHGRTELSVDDDGIIVTALYICDDGYHLHGTSQLTCDTDTDQWQGDLPACKLGKPLISYTVYFFYFFFCQILKENVLKTIKISDSINRNG